MTRVSQGDKCKDTYNTIDLSLGYWLYNATDEVATGEFSFYSFKFLSKHADSFAESPEVDFD